MIRSAYWSALGQEGWRTALDDRPDNLSDYANRPLGFLGRYVRARAWSHCAIFIAVMLAVGCSVSTQYAVRVLVDTLSSGARDGLDIWSSFVLLVSLIVGDNLLWRLAGWIASY